MIAYGDHIRVFCGNSNPQFAETICKELGIPMGKSTVKTFSDGEVSVSLEETVRGADVFLVQSTCKPVNDNLMELLVMIDACRRASAGRITAVIPYYGYARQDRKAKSRDPISAKMVANMITAAGADRVLTMYLHAAQMFHKRPEECTLVDDSPVYCAAARQAGWHAIGVRDDLFAHRREEFDAVCDRYLCDLTAF